MLAKLLAASVLAFGLALADNHTPYYGPKGAVNASTPTAIENGVTIHYVAVGNGGNTFVPNSLDARPGDKIMFTFYANNHSVIRAAYGWPCEPYEDVVQGGHQFYSGFFPVTTDAESLPTWSLTVNHTQPDFYYCGAPGSCVKYGMLGVINANASRSIAKQLELAHREGNMLEIGQPVPVEGASLSRLVNSVTSVTTATRVVISTAATHTSSAPSPSAEYDHSSGLSNGAVAGIAVGAAAGALCVAGFFFLLYRTRSLKRKLNRQQEASAQAARRPDLDLDGPAGNTPSSALHDTGRRKSPLPPYHPYQNMEHFSRDPNKPADEMNPPAPYTIDGQFMPVQPQDGNHQFSPNRTSQLRGNMRPFIELDGAHTEMTEQQM